MSTYIILLLLLVMAAVTIYAYTHQKYNKRERTTDMNEQQNTTPLPEKKKPRKKPTQEELALQYADRKGYDATFVKTRKFKIELDDLLKNNWDKLSDLTFPTPGNNHFLHYQHFTVAMNKERKMPLIAAVNIDGSQSVENPRGSDKWIYDPRLDKEEQLGKEIYKNNNLDLGHLIRRLDPVWGEHALKADEDTFHFTVCAPQHKKLNRVTWLSLESYILKNTDIEDLKVSVFTGPVFSDRDWEYRSVKLPLQFWKMVALIKKNGTPSVTAYLLSHESFLSDMGERAIIGEEGFGAFKTYQISLDKLQEMTQLNLEPYKVYDPLSNLRSLAGQDYQEITDSHNIVL